MDKSAINWQSICLKTDAFDCQPNYLKGNLILVEAPFENLPENIKALTPEVITALIFMVLW